METATLYDEDIVAWAEQQAQAVRALASRPDLSNALDWENLAEEIESLGRSQIQGVESKLSLILVHLIKMVSDPRSGGLQHWRAEITAFQRVARKEYTPSMRQRFDVDDIWQGACKEAEAALFQYGTRPSRALPTTSPFRLDELLSPEFDVDTALVQLSTATAVPPDAPVPRPRRSIRLPLSRK